MRTVLLSVLCAAIGYLLGCFSTGLIISRLYGRIDIRNYGSGNAGMTNVMRTLGWVPSILTFVGDMAKGVGAALIGKCILGDLGMHFGGLFAVVGHNWPVFFKFKGGKGISTSFGYIIVFDWRIALLLVAVQMPVLLSTGLMSLSSIVSSVAFSVFTIAFQKPTVYIVFALIASAMALYSHRANIKRLINKTENKLNIKKITQKSKEVNEGLKKRKKGEE